MAGDPSLCLDAAMVPSSHLQEVKAEKWRVQRVNTCDSGDMTLEGPEAACWGTRACGQCAGQPPALPLVIKPLKMQGL